MKREIPVILVVVAMLVIWSVPAFASEEPLVTQESLLGLVKPYVNNMNEEISRGAFSYILVNAANLSDKETVKDLTLPLDLKDTWYKDAIVVLCGKNIMIGAPDGNTYPENPITVLQAKTLIARIFGIPDEVIFETDSKGENDLEKRLYSYIEGYFKGDAESKISVNDAAGILSDFFGVDEEAKGIILRNEEVTDNAKSFRASGTMETELVLDQEIDELPSKMNFDFSLEFSMDNKIKQEITGVVPNLPMPLKMVQYMDKDYIYTMVVDEEGTPQWMKMKNFVSFAFDDEFMEAKKNETLNIDTDLPYKVLGEETIEGIKCYKLAFYTRIDDKDELLKIFDCMPGMDDANKELMKESMDIIENLILKGIMYIGQEDDMLYRSEISYDIFFNEELQTDSPVKIKMMNYIMDITYSDFGEDIKIEIPQEAIEAEEIDLFGEGVFDAEGTEPLEDIELEQ